MATRSRSKKPPGLAVLSLREAAGLLRCPMDELVRRPGFLALVIDLSGRRLPAGRLGEEDFDDLLIRQADLSGWLDGLRYGVAA